MCEERSLVCNNGSFYEIKLFEDNMWSKTYLICTVHGKEMLLIEFGLMLHTVHFSLMREGCKVKVLLTFFICEHEMGLSTQIQCVNNTCILNKVDEIWILSLWNSYQSPGIIIQHNSLKHTGLWKDNLSRNFLEY